MLGHRGSPFIIILKIYFLTWKAEIIEREVGRERSVSLLVHSPGGRQPAKLRRLLFCLPRRAGGERHWEKGYQESERCPLP